MKTSLKHKVIMIRIEPGNKLLCLFNTKLPGKSKGPNLIVGKEYICKRVFMDSKGNDHIDVGLPLEIESVSSFATGEELPSDCHWCHPNRFVIV